MDTWQMKDIYFLWWQRNPKSTTSNQIWRVGLNFNGKGIYSLSPSEMKGNINNCPSIDKYKLAKPFHQNKCKKQIFFSALVVKAYMYVMEGPKSTESLQLTVCLSLNTPFKLNQNTKISLLMATFEKVIGVCN